MLLIETVSDHNLGRRNWIYWKQIRLFANTLWQERRWHREREYEELGDDDNSLRFYGIPRKEFCEMNINQESAEAKRDKNFQYLICGNAIVFSFLFLLYWNEELNEIDNKGDSFVLTKSVAKSSVNRMGILGHGPTYVNIWIEYFVLFNHYDLRWFLFCSILSYCPGLFVS